MMNPFSCSRPGRLTVAACLAVMVGPVSALDNKDLTFNGMGWVQYGRVVHSTDTANFDYNGNTMQSSGAQISFRAHVSEKFEGAAGLGVLENHYLSGNVIASAGGSRVPLIQTPYIAEARFKYSFWKGEGANLNLTGGLFTFNYNPDVKNLGLYLLRGPVHPGIVMSGFETKPVLPIANTLGFQLHHETGNFQQDLILNSETDLNPFYDVSPAYLLGYQAGSVLRVGAGVNFYRYLPIEPKLTSPSQLSPNDRDIDTTYGKHPYNRNYIYVDTVNHDTTFISFKGIKLMANAAFDPKALFGGIEILGKEDLKIYGEVALFGLENEKAYKDIYGDYLHRMPVMFGFNLPAFRLLDNLSLEMEWYGAKFRDDLTRFYPSAKNYPSPLPVANQDWKRVQDPINPGISNQGVPWSIADLEQNLKKDNWKWSLYGSREIQGHFRVSFQLANDHLRPGGTVGYASGEAILSAPKDWYWMTKLAYFF